MTVGRARLAFAAGRCVRCGLCMTGCPYSLIYSSSQTFDRLRAARRIDYLDGLLVVEVGQDGTTPFVIAEELGSDRRRRFEADRVYLACGAVGTTRLVLSSLGIFDQDVELAESAQFVVPMVSLRPVPDPTVVSEFTLNQFNMAVTLDDIGLDVAQIHFYPHNPAMEDALPGLLRSPMGRPLGVQVLRRLTVGLGYLPSWESPKLRMRVTPPDTGGGPAGIRLSGDERVAAGNPMLRSVTRRMLRAAPRLDLWPVVPMASMSAPGKSYHFGGSLPHRTAPADGPITTDRLGRLAAWSRVHVVDASVFPTVPATTFTLTIMANAHRIATGVDGVRRMRGPTVGTVAVTGASGYLGGVLRERLARGGWDTVDLVRNPEGRSGRSYVMGEEPGTHLLDGVDVLVHCAYDMSVRSRQEIWQVNVDGARRLLDAADRAGVHRTVMVSSMSAYDGTSQLYGLAKLEIERASKEHGALSVRPGLAYGPGAGGMAGALTRLTALPVVPVVAARSHQFTVHHDDVADAVVALIERAPRWSPIRSGSPTRPPCRSGSWWKAWPGWPGAPVGPFRSAGVRSSPRCGRPNASASIPRSAPTRSSGWSGRRPTCPTCRCWTTSASPFAGSASPGPEGRRSPMPTRDGAIGRPLTRSGGAVRVTAGGEAPRGCPALEADPVTPANGRLC